METGKKVHRKKKIGTGLRTFLEWDLISFCGVLSKLTYNSLQPQITLVYQTISLLCKLKVHVLAHTALTTLDSIHVFAHTHTHTSTHTATHALSVKMVGHYLRTSPGIVYAGRSTMQSVVLLLLP